MDSCKETKTDKNVVVETDVVIFPMDDFNKDEGKSSTADKSLKNFKPLKEKLKLFRPKNDLV